MTRQHTPRPSFFPLTFPPMEPDSKTTEIVVNELITLINNGHVTSKAIEAINFAFIQHNKQLTVLQVNGLQSRLIKYLPSNVSKDIDLIYDVIKGGKRLGVLFESLLAFSIEFNKSNSLFQEPSSLLPCPDLTIIYALRLRDNKYYIGGTHADNFDLRLTMHRCGEVLEWTKRHRPLEGHRAIVGYYILENSPDLIGDEVNEITIKYMKYFGVDNVRGGSFTDVKLKEFQKVMIYNKLRCPLPEDDTISYPVTPTISPLHNIADFVDIRIREVLLPKYGIDDGGKTESWDLERVRNSVEPCIYIEIKEEVERSLMGKIMLAPHGFKGIDMIEFVDSCSGLERAKVKLIQCKHGSNRLGLHGKSAHMLYTIFIKMFEAQSLIDEKYLSFEDKDIEYHLYSTMSMPPSVEATGEYILPYNDTVLPIWRARKLIIHNRQEIWGLIEPWFTKIFPGMDPGLFR